MPTNILLTFKNHSIDATIPLTGSKSESNRALILKAIGKELITIENLSDAADTVTLSHVVASLSNPLEQKNFESIDIGPAGTAMRFLTAYLSTQPGNFELTGSARMKQRPIGILVDALKSLGAHIDYKEASNYPPLLIQGSFKQLQQTISIPGNISSQYLSALLLIAPRLPMGLRLEITSELTSKPYLEMTLSMLEQVGITHFWEGNQLCITDTDIVPSTLRIEPDWSAASYWYSIAALSKTANLFLPGLTKYSLQGDSVITELMANFGITTEFIAGGARLTKGIKNPQKKIFNLIECPDLAQTLIVYCAIIGYEATFTGLETLKIKETDRILALQNELQKIGVSLQEDSGNYSLNCENLHFPKSIFIRTYEDHRMAMAFAPLALFVEELEIEDQSVVNKSYPSFWKHLQLAGFEVKEL